jgi:hypothetical protein
MMSRSEQNPVQIGTQRRGVVTGFRASCQLVLDDQNETHFLYEDAEDPAAEIGDRGVLTFAIGSSRRAYWHFQKEKHEDSTLASSRQSTESSRALFQAATRA